ncbi:unnamed protein product [Spirodela intermedia]|uniref:Inhibitor I9 domain-containing protein n=2 Tax=Spirodela intermedia TaxID=51605 RepID=A0A7I8KHW5_SPIIN|nr:unnamed protein product [Spirodela intermedia]CAA6661048.1 unnamed protein product [Spirodela intermedia]CAA7397409.1 unnamed protein product [Spirodela intermedia]
MGSKKTYFVFMNFDPEYERLRKNRARQEELDMYLSRKHERLLSELLEPNTYSKKSSLVIVDGFAVEITDEQAKLLRSSNKVRIVEKNQELE